MANTKISAATALSAVGDSDQIPVASSGASKSAAGSKFYRPGATKIALADITDPGSGKVLTSAGSGTIAALPPGYRFNYKQSTSDQTSTQTVQASATTALTADSITFDGSTVIRVEFGAIISNSGTNTTFVRLWEDSTDVTRIAQHPGSGAGGFNIVGKYFYTPTSGAKVLSIRFYVGAGTGTLFGTVMPTYLEITKAA